MARPQQAPLRPLTEAERLARAGSERADRVARARALLGVAAGQACSAAARAAGRRAGAAGARLVVRFNPEGLAALQRRHGGGPPVVDAAATRDRSLQELRRPPDRERDGTATGSLTTLQRARRTAADGWPRVGRGWAPRPSCPPCGGRGTPGRRAAPGAGRAPAAASASAGRSR